jgi:predicted dehydrogenase
VQEREIGIGVVGFGWMGRVHTSSYRRVVEHFPDLGIRPRLVVAAEVSETRRRQAERVGFAETTDDWRAVVEHPGVELVSITMPNSMHREVALAAIAAGKHLWVEKPVGRGVEDTAAVAEAARDAGVLTGVGFCYRFAPAVQHARHLICAGEVGEVTHYRGVFLADYANRPDAAASWRFLRADAGSGALGDLMAHVVDMTHFLVGPIDRVSGRTATMIPRRPRLPVGRARTSAVWRPTTSSTSRTRTGRPRCASSAGAPSARSRPAASSSGRACGCASRSSARAARWPGSSSA